MGPNAFRWSPPHCVEPNVDTTVVIKKNATLDEIERGALSCLENEKHVPHVAVVLRKAHIDGGSRRWVIIRDHVAHVE